MEYGIIKVFEYFKNKYKNVHWLNADLSTNEITKILNLEFLVMDQFYLSFHKNKVSFIISNPCSNYNFSFTPKNKKEYEKLILSSGKLRCKKNSKKKVEEFYYMFAAYNHDAFENTAKKIQLKKLDFSRTSCLKNYISKLN